MAKISRTNEQRGKTSLRILNEEMKKAVARADERSTEIITGRRAKVKKNTQQAHFKLTKQEERKLNTLCKKLNISKSDYFRRNLDADYKKIFSKAEQPRNFISTDDLISNIDVLNNLVISLSQETSHEFENLDERFRLFIKNMSIRTQNFYKRDEKMIREYNNIIQNYKNFREEQLEFFGTVKKMFNNLEKKHEQSIGIMREIVKAHFPEHAKSIDSVEQYYIDKENLPVLVEELKKILPPDRFYTLMKFYDKQSKSEDPHEAMRQLRAMVVDLEDGIKEARAEKAAEEARRVNNSAGVRQKSY